LEIFGAEFYAGWMPFLSPNQECRGEVYVLSEAKDLVLDQLVT